MGWGSRLAPIVGIAAVLLAGDAWRGDDAWAATPADRLREFFAAGNRVLLDPATADRPQGRLEAVRRLVGDLFDFRRAAERALGDEWSRRSPAEREEFVRLFTAFIEAAYIRNLASVIRLDAGASVTVLDEAERGPAAAVTTAVERRSGGEVMILYMMTRHPDRWMVEDVVIDGVSLVDNYRAQMRRVLARGSYATLVAEMRARSHGDGLPAVGLEEPVARPPVALVPQITHVAAAADAAPLEAVDEGGRRVARPVPGAGEQRPVREAASSATAAPPVDSTPSVAVPPTLAAGTPSPAAAPPPVVARATPDAGARGIANAARAVVTYWVQVGAFRSAEAVTRLVARLGEPSVAVRATPASMPLLRVLVGPFPGLAEATAAVKALRDRGYRPFIAEERD